jgi:hypothetical protein
MPDPYTFLPKRLVREARRYLWRHGIRPTGEHWTRAIRWCEQVSHSYEYTVFGTSAKRRRWPSGHELASMYLFYVYADFRPELPYRATARAGERFVPPPGFDQTMTGRLDAIRRAELPPAPPPALPAPSAQALLFPEE